MAEKIEYPNLNWLTLEDTRHIELFDTAWWHGKDWGSIDWIKDEPFDKAKTETLIRHTHVDPGIATLLMQIAHTEERYAADKHEHEQYQDDLIDGFYWQTELYRQVKDLIVEAQKHDDKTVQIAAERYIASVV